MTGPPSSDDDADEPTAADAAPPDSGDPSRAASGDAAATTPADSRWWYWVAAVPAFYVVATLAGFLFGMVAFAVALTGAAGAGYGVDPGVGVPVGVGFVGAFLLFAVLFAVGGVLSLVFPVAIYLDADAVAETAGDWTPDPELYGILGLLGVLLQPLQAPLGVYYLYRRRQSEGAP